MRVFLWLLFVGYILGFAFRLGTVAGKHPRTVTYNEGEDVLAVLEYVGLAAWTGYFLFR